MATEPHSLPAKAVWASPMKKGKTGKRVLLDPDGFRLHYKDFKSGKQVYLCSRKKDLKCCSPLLLIFFHPPPLVLVYWIQKKNEVCDK